MSSDGKRYIYSIYDKAAEEGHPCFEMKSHTLAKRYFIGRCAETPFAADDLELRVIGESYFDRGVILGYGGDGMPNVIMTGVEAMKYLNDVQEKYGKTQTSHQ